MSENTEVAPLSPDQGWQRDPNSRSLSFYAGSQTKTVNQVLVSELQTAALEFGSARVCLHASANERTHVMLIAQCAGDYSPPKRHPRYGKWIHVISGELLVAAFTDQGGVETREILTSGQSFGVYFPRNVFHTNFPVSDVSVFVEAVAGPFARADSNFDAPWAPTIRDQDLGRKFRDALILSTPESAAVG